MKFIVDVNLPPKLVAFLNERGHEAIRADVLDGDAPATDSTIARWAEENAAVVATKDDDFRLLQLATGRPPKILMVATGNISNRELLTLFTIRIAGIETALSTARRVELDRTTLVIDAGPGAPDE